MNFAKLSDALQHLRRPWFALLFLITIVSPASTALAAPSVSINDVSKTEGNSGTKDFEFELRLSGPASQDVTIAYSTADGSATLSNNDYVAVSSTATIRAGDDQTRIKVRVVGDQTRESDETFFVSLLGVTNATILDGTGLGTILNDDGLPKISIRDVSQNEGNTGTTAFNFLLELNHPTDQDVTVDYATTDGSATAANNDYVSVSGTATILAKSLSTAITVLVVGDRTREPDERFFVDLSNVVNANTDRTRAVGKIENDDGVPTLSINNVVLAEGNAGTTAYEFTVMLTNPIDHDVTVDFETVDGSATVADGDYQSTSGTATIPAKAQSVTISVPVNGDETPELDEIFLVELFHSIGASISDAQGQGVILNDDGSVGVGDRPVTEFALGVIAPNPSRGATRIDFALPRESYVRLTVLDVQGREVAVLAEGVHQPGRHQGVWTGHIAGRMAPAGIYFARYQTPAKSFVRRIVMVR